MSKDIVTNKDLYTEILKIHEKMDSLVDSRITPLERRMDQIWIYMTGIIAGITLLVNLGVSYFKERWLKL